MFSLETRACVSCNLPSKFRCNGCRKIFCQNHADEHQESLDEQLDWLTVDYSDLARELSDRSLVLARDHPAMITIDRWESETITRVRQTAIDTRQAVINAVEKHNQNVRAKLQLLMTKLSEAAARQLSFDEIQLKQWTTALCDLKQKLKSASICTVHVQDDKPVLDFNAVAPTEFQFKDHNIEQSQSHGLVPIPSSSPPKIDRFEWVCGDIQIQENGQIVVHKSTTIDASVRGLLKYHSGIHRLFFRIERMYKNHWLFFGIVSSGKPAHHQSYMMPSAYGWAGYNYVYANGKYEAGKNGYRGDMKENNNVELTLDCDRHILYLWYSGSKYKEKLIVDVNTCPIPWQFLVCLCNANDSVSILPSSTRSIIEKEQEHIGMIIRPNDHNPENFLIWPTKAT